MSNPRLLQERIIWTHARLIFGDTDMVMAKLRDGVPTGEALHPDKVICVTTGGREDHTAALAFNLRAQMGPRRARKGEPERAISRNLNALIFSPEGRYLTIKNPRPPMPPMRAGWLDKYRYAYDPKHRQRVPHSLRLMEELNSALHEQDLVDRACQHAWDESNRFMATATETQRTDRRLAALNRSHMLAGVTIDSTSTTIEEIRAELDWRYECESARVRCHIRFVKDLVELGCDVLPSANGLDEDVSQQVILTYRQARVERDLYLPEVKRKSFRVDVSKGTVTLTLHDCNKRCTKKSDRLARKAYKDKNILQLQRQSKSDVSTGMLRRMRLSLRVDNNNLDTPVAGPSGSTDGGGGA